MATRNWDVYVRKRFKAQKNLVWILRQQGIPIVPGSWFDPIDVEMFKSDASWGARIDPQSGRGYFIRDQTDPKYIIIPFIDDNGQPGQIYISFIGTGDDAKAKITKKAFAVELLKFLEVTTGKDMQQAFFSNMVVNRGVKCILISLEELDGNTKNEMIRFNTILEYPIRHYTLAELQYNPTLHATGIPPENIRVATKDEEREYIERQRGLLIGTRHRLVPDFEKRLNEIDDPNERASFINKTDEEVLACMPTINTTDPYVKWYGYKLDDVLIIKRRFGMNVFTYRRVTEIERAPKQPKEKVAVTNK